jgi:hypothetical protein
VALAEELESVAAAVARFAEEGEELVGVLAAEPASGERLYVCAFERGEERSWLVVDAEGAPVEDRARMREAASIAAVCELAEETAAGGNLDELRAQLLTLRLTENPEGIEEAEEAALELESTLSPPPRVASPAYLDRIGAATMKLERALGDAHASPFAEAMKAGMGAVEELSAEVERTYKLELSPDL